MSRRPIRKITRPPVRGVGETRRVASPDLEALGLDVLDIVRPDGAPATEQDLAAADALAAPGANQAQITITLADPEVILSAFATVFGYQDTVRDILNPRDTVPNPMSRADFAAAILREYVGQVVRLAESKGTQT